MRTQAMAASDTYSTIVAQAHDALAKKTKRPEVARWALERKVYVAMASLTNVTGPNDSTTMLDMLVLSTLARCAVEDYWIPTLLHKEGAELLELYRDGEAQVWRLAAKCLTAEQLGDIRALIEQWRRSHPNQYYVSHIRFADFIRAEDTTRGRPGLNLPTSVFGLLYMDPLAGLDPVTKELQGYKALTERMAFLLARMPIILGWQVQVLVSDAGSTPSVVRVVDGAEKFTATFDRLADVLARYPADLSAERKAAIEQGIAGINQQREAILHALEAQGTQLRAMMADAKGVVERADQAGLSVNTATRQTVTSTEESVHRLLDHAFWLSLTLILVLIIGIRAAMVLYRRLAPNGRLDGVGHEHRRSRSMYFAFLALGLAASAPAEPGADYNTMKLADTAAIGGGATAKPADPSGILATPDYSGDIWNRSTLTGDWGRIRQDWARKGFTLDWNLTQVGQTIFSGGRDNAWKYGARSNATFNLDTGRMGLWAGGLFTVETEGRFGETVNASTGAVIPVNANGLFPEPLDTEWTIPCVMYTQFLAPQVGVFFGKLDTTSGDANAFAHGKGNEQFLNLAFNLNPALLVSTPYSTLGGGLVVLPTNDTQITFMVFDPNGRADTTGFDNPFKGGPAYAMEGRLTTHFFDLTGHQLLGGTYSTKNFINLDQPLANLIVPFLPAEQSSNTWCVYYNFDQYLYQPEKNADQGLGIFARFGASDGEANPVHYFASAGVGGKGLIPGRKHDQLGVGYYYIWATLPQRPVDAGLVDRFFGDDTQGVELYYDIAITPWMRLTPDLQIIDPAAQEVDTTLVAGARLELKL